MFINLKMEFSSIVVGERKSDLLLGKDMMSVQASRLWENFLLQNGQGAQSSYFESRMVWMTSLLDVSYMVILFKVSEFRVIDRMYFDEFDRITSITLLPSVTNLY